MQHDELMGILSKTNVIFQCWVLMFAVTAPATSSPLHAAESSERNVALATAGAQITADSTGVFGRNDPTYGAADEEISPGRLIDGRWVKKAGGWQEARGNRWISQMDRPHPHWAWINFSGAKRINRVLLRCSSLENYPTDFRGQYSTDGGVTVKELFAARNVKPDTNTLVIECRFEPVVTDNFRLIIDRSTTPRSPKYTQLSEIEVYGEDAAAMPPMKSEAPADKLPARMLKPATDKEVRIEERAGEIEFRTPWQRLVFARNRAQITALGWDSEGTGRLDINLLEKGEAGGIQPRIELAYGPVRPLPSCELRREGNVVRYGPLEAARGVALTWEVKIGAKSVEMAVARAVARPLAVKPGLVRFGWDSGQTPTAPFYRRPGELGQVGLPCLLHAADCGSALMTCGNRSVAGFAWEGSEYASGKTWIHADLAEAFPSRSDGLLELAPGVWQGRIRWSVERIVPLANLVEKEPRLKGFSRYALNGLQFRPDTDLLSNSVGSINCCFCLWEYAEVAQFLPVLPGGIDPCDLLRRSLDTYVAGTPGHDVGNVSIYDPDYNTLVDTKPALIYAAWTVIRKTGDLEQLRRWLPHLEHIVRLMEETDEDGDGLLEPVKSTRYGGWYDTVRENGKSAYGNALAYRAFKYAADLEELAGRPEQAKHDAELAERIRRAFFSTLFNPETGVIAGWKDKEGKLHDYWFPWISGMAIVYGLVPEKEANSILDRFQAKFKEVGFTRFDLGLPNCLVEIPKPDYAVDNKFKEYLNGGASPCFSYFYIQALYQTGRRAEADRILWPIIASFDAGLFNGGYGLGRGDTNHQEWHTWDGLRCGGEGFLPDSYHVLNALYHGYYGITFGPEGYRLAAWSLLKGQSLKTGLTFMGSEAKAEPGEKAAKRGNPEAGGSR